MSRWADQFEKHAIHETLRQAYEWASIEIEKIDSDHEAEQRRMIKAIDLIMNVVAGMDPDFFPDQQLTALNNHLKHQNFWNQLNTYSSNGNIQHLRTANDHLSGQTISIYQLSGMARQPESREAIKGTEAAYDAFCKTLEKTKDEFVTTAEKKASEIAALEARTNDLDTSLQSLATNTETQIAMWQKEFTKAETARVQEHADAQLGRSREYEVALDHFKSSSKKDRVDTTKKHDDALRETFEKYSENTKTKTEDINAKHQSILDTHRLVTNDGVAGGYKRGADDEKKAALWWSIVSMLCYGHILLWVLLKGKLGFGVADTEGIDWPLIVTTVSVTGVAFVAAQFAGRQSRVHRMNEQRMRWFSFEIAAIDPFISSLPVPEQQKLKQQLSEKLFGQDRVIDDKPSKVRGLDPKSIKSVTNPITEAIKALKS